MTLWSYQNIKLPLLHDPTRLKYCQFINHFLPFFSDICHTDMTVHSTKLQLHYYTLPVSVNRPYCITGHVEWDILSVLLNDMFLCEHLVYWRWSSTKGHADWSYQVQCDLDKSLEWLFVSIFWIFLLFLERADIVITKISIETYPCNMFSIVYVNPGLFLRPFTLF